MIQDPRDRPGMPADRALQDRLLAAERELKNRLGGPIADTDNKLQSDGLFTGKPWWVMAYYIGRQHTGETKHQQIGLWSRKQLAVSVANQLGIDVPTLLDADPLEEIELLKEGLATLADECDNDRCRCQKFGSK